MKTQEKEEKKSVKKVSKMNRLLGFSTRKVIEPSSMMTTIKGFSILSTQTQHAVFEKLVIFCQSNNFDFRNSTDDIKNRNSECLKNLIYRIKEMDALFYIYRPHLYHYL